MSSNPYDSSNFRDPAHFRDSSPGVTGAELKHSGLGIASFVMSILVGLSIFAAMVTTAFVESAKGAEVQDDSPEAVILGFTIIGLLFVDLLALALGVAGLVQPNRQKIFAVLGTVFSLLIVLGTVGLIVIGLTMAS